MLHVKHLLPIQATCWRNILSSSWSLNTELVGLTLSCRSPCKPSDKTSAVLRWRRRKPQEEEDLTFYQMYQFSQECVKYLLSYSVIGKGLPLILFCRNGVLKHPYLHKRHLDMSTTWIFCQVMFHERLPVFQCCSSGLSYESHMNEQTVFGCFWTFSKWDIIPIP